MTPSRYSQASQQPLFGTLMPPTDPPGEVDYTRQLTAVSLPRHMVAITGLLGIAGFVILNTLVTFSIYWFCWLFHKDPPQLSGYIEIANRFEIPEGVLGAQLGLAVMIPFVLALLYWVCGLKPKWVCSVQPGMRWRYLLITFVIAAIGIGAVLWFGQLKDLGPVHPQQNFWWFAVVLILCTPFQAAAEEFFFRGFALTVWGGLTRNTWAGVFLSALFFALLHGTQNLPLFLDRFGFGLIAAVLVVTTGGLEAAIAIHIANNLWAFFTAGLWTSISQARTVHEITWMQAGVDVGTFALLGLLCWAIGTKLQLATATPATAGPSRRKKRKTGVNPV